MGESPAKNRWSVRYGERRKRQVSAARGYGSSDRASGHTGSAATTALASSPGPSLRVGRGLGTRLLQHVQQLLQQPQGGGETEQRDLAV